MYHIELLIHSCVALRPSTDLSYCAPPPLICHIEPLFYSGVTLSPYSTHISYWAPSLLTCYTEPHLHSYVALSPLYSCVTMNSSCAYWDSPLLVSFPSTHVLHWVSPLLMSLWAPPLLMSHWASSLLMCHTELILLCVKLNSSTHISHWTLHACYTELLLYSCVRVNPFSIHVILCSSFILTSHWAPPPLPCHIEALF